MTIHKDNIPKILIQKIFKENRGLAERIAKINSKKEDRITTLSANVIRKAVKGKVVHFDTKFEIYCSLLDLKLIKINEVSVNDLFSKI